ncbi:MAG: amidohydrolase family protein [Planctomycetota bacterium]|nr:amidohydrolase family protein [Planctomycetota bacterium]
MTSSGTPGIPGTPIDILVQGGTIHSATASFVGDVAIRGETIVGVGAPGAFGSAAAKVIDARGMDVIPGCIDVHVHLALPFCGTVSCDDFHHGSRAAVNGGVTTVIDFAIPARGQSLAAAHDAWMAKAQGKSLVDFTWHMAVTSDAHLREVPDMVKRGLPTFKEFMIYESEGWNSDDARLYATLELMRANNAMLLVHAESSRVLDLLIARHHTPEMMRRHGAKLHPITRPNFIEAEAIERAVRWCEKTGGRLYVVHMSTGEGADIIKDAQSRGVPVLAETCAQYLVLDDSVFNRPDGHLFACCPQVKKQEDIDRLWSALRDGREVSIVSTDTCSFTREQKAMWWDREGKFGDWTKIPMGLPGLDTLIPIVFTRGVRGGQITMNRLVELCALNPARVMGFDKKGEIAPGMDADVVVIDPKRTVEVKPRVTLQSMCDWSPYEGMKLGGFAHTTIARGNLVVQNHQVTNASPRGRFVERRLGEFRP